MSISNLHTILNKPWYIEQNYGAAHLPLVFNILNGKAITSKPEDEAPIITYLGLNGSASNSSSTQQVAVLSIKNPIVKHDQFCGPQGTKSMMRELDSLKNNDSIAGVVLDIDSGGGQAYGTAEFYDYLRNYQKPIVAYTDGLMCSAAYYIGSAASHIVANKRAEAIGSIGAYTQILDLTGYYEKEGAKLHTIYATKSTEKNKAYRDVLEGNYESYIKQELDPLVETFHADMLAARPGLKEATLKGGTWNGADALKQGLIDEVGTIETAINKVFELSDKKPTNTKTMSTNRENLQAVLGIDAPLAATEEGSYLNDEQLNDIETAFSTHETALQTAQDATQLANTTVDALNATNETLVAQVNTALELTGDNAVTNITDAVAALNAHIATLGNQPGETHTKTGKEDEAGAAYPNMDFNTPFYNNIKKHLN